MGRNNRKSIATNTLKCLEQGYYSTPIGKHISIKDAQEESIARATGLYPCLLQAPDYYAVNRTNKSCFYTDYMIYSPSVPILKDEAGNYLEELMTTAIITAPAVNTSVVKRREHRKTSKIEKVMRRRIEKVLAIASEQGHRNIVLGAWDCGVF